MAAKGVNGEIELTRDGILRIRREGALSFLTQGLKGEKEILISQITAVQFKNAGTLTNGYIQFSFTGGNEAKGGLFQATKDENSVMFKRGKQQTAFVALKERIDSIRSESMNTGNNSSNLDEIEKLASLRDRGIITEEEFEAKKRDLLGI